MPPRPVTAGQRGFFTRGQDGQITAADLAGRQFTRVPDIRATGQPEPLLSYFLNGIKRMPFTFTPPSSP
jgi:hypothetical protein